MFFLTCLVGDPVVWHWIALPLVVVMLVMQDYRWCFIMIRSVLFMVTLSDLIHSVI